MTVNERIIEALSPFGYPVKADICRDGSPRYFTFNYADDRGEDFGDNTPQTVTAYMQIHLFLPMNDDYLAEKAKVRQALVRAGFTFPEITELNEPEKNIRHLVYECEIESEE